jgi:hypothetical protein
MNTTYQVCVGHVIHGFNLINSFQIVPDGVPDDSSENIEEGTLTLSRKVVLSLFKPLLDSISDYCRASVKNLRTAVDSAYPDMAGQQFQSVLFTGGLLNSLVVRKELENLACFKDVEKIFPGQKGGCDTICHLAEDFRTNNFEERLRQSGLLLGVIHVSIYRGY